MVPPVIKLGLLSLLLFSVGCRMCPTPHDYRVSGYVHRCDDYRGFNPVYRAGSIFSGLDCGTCQTDIGDAYYVGGAGGFYTNAGSYGNTIPISTIRRTPDGSDIRPPRVPVAIPMLEPDAGGLIEPRRNNTDTDLPSFQELLNQQRGTTFPPTPLVPPTRERVAPPPLDGAPTDTIPFSPSDEVIVPPDPFPTTTDSDLPITLEELRRLDPSVQDLQIISIEDAAIEAAAR